MPDDDTTRLLRRLVGDGPDARTAVLDAAGPDAAPEVLVAAAVIGRDPALLDRAAARAVTSRDRQLSAIGAACLRGDEDLLDALLRDHLADHPDSLLAVWIAARQQPDPAPVHPNPHCDKD